MFKMNFESETDDELSTGEVNQKIAKFKVSFQPIQKKKKKKKRWT